MMKGVVRVGSHFKSLHSVRTADCKLPLSLHSTARSFVLKRFSVPDTVNDKDPFSLRLAA